MDQRSMSRHQYSGRRRGAQLRQYRQETSRVGMGSEHARIPVFQGTADNVTGILYAKDLVPAAGGVLDPPS